MATLLLDGQWTLTSLKDPEITTLVTLPGDIHSALLNANIIVDPYLGCNENEVQWVGEHHWRLTRRFELSSDFLRAKAVDLKLSMVDTVAEISINDQVVLNCSNMFRQYQHDVLPMLVEGENRIDIVLQRADIEAKKRAQKLPFPIPWAVGNNKIPHMNMLRKTQCHAGWDWGICLMVSGVYDSIELVAVQHHRLEGCDIEQRWDGNHCQVVVCIEHSALPKSEESVAVVRLTSPSGEEQRERIPIRGEQTSVVFDVTEPIRWWPAGYGEQPLYRLTVELDEQIITKRIGLRELELVTETDNVGKSMSFRCNGVMIFAKGANWIPLDAMPSKQTPERYQQLLTDAKAANMNMLRVWGGGMYERDCFYNLCDELGLLIWQDLMFSCALYPSTTDFVEDVEIEVKQQVKRLKHHASLSIWCGDNEVIGAISWYPESKSHREKYVVNYDRLNRALQVIVEENDPSRRFWASSPCNGELDYGDAWHDDNMGDMHFWDVWHSGKSFDAYGTVKPRFCSEFGYQSWPSLPTVKTYADAEEWNVTSPTFEQHQKNGRGNSIITEMFTRYFRFPMKFEQMLYLSQVQQALAIKTASEYWRANKPVCRGVLYWQLNDCWPVSSWSSIEYTGRWKQLHYHAKRFFSAQLATFVEKDDSLTLQLINDQQQSVTFVGDVTWYHWDGQVIESWPINTCVAADANDTAWTLNRDEYDLRRRDGFFHVSFGEGKEELANSWFADVYKALPLIKAELTFDIECIAGELEVIVSTTAPAFYVHLEYAHEGRFSDSSFTLLPNQPRRVRFYGEATAHQLAEDLTVYHLATSYQP